MGQELQEELEEGIRNGMDFYQRINEDTIYRQLPVQNNQPSKYPLMLVSYMCVYRQYKSSAQNNHLLSFQLITGNIKI